LASEGKNAFPGKGYLIPEKEELQRLRKENQRLRMERDILKKAAAFFAKESM
jgi:transposase